MQWTAHPAARRPKDVVLVAAVALLFAGAVLATLQSVFLAVLAIVVLVISVSGFLLPTRYELTRDAVIERRMFFTRQRRWQDLRRVQVGTGAALVSPFAKPNFLDRYRGMVLSLDGADRQKVVETIRARLSRDA